MLGNSTHHEPGSPGACPDCRIFPCSEVYGTLGSLFDNRRERKCKKNRDGVPNSYDDGGSDARDPPCSGLPEGSRGVVGRGPPSKEAAPVMAHRLLDLLGGCRLHVVI